MLVNCILSVAIAFVITLSIVRFLVRLGLVLDIPGARSLHLKPVPRIGGVGILLGVFGGVLVHVSPTHPIFLSVLFLAIVSLIDDFRHLPILVRIVAHIVACGTYIFYAGSIDNLLLFVFIVLVLAWMTNLYNFMDGSDGLAAIMAIVGFTAYFIMALLQGNQDIAIFSIAIVSAVAAFLVYNFPPAKIFMGDVGSISLGFLAGSIGFAGWVVTLWPWQFPLIIFSPFIVDATLTLCLRIINKKLIWKAHREHFYQKAVLSGFSRSKILFAEALIMMVFAGTGFIFVFSSRIIGMSVFVLLIFLLFVLAFFINKNYKYFEENQVRKNEVI